MHLQLMMVLFSITILSSCSALKAQKTNTENREVASTRTPSSSDSESSGTTIVASKYGSGFVVKSESGQWVKKGTFNSLEKLGVRKDAEDKAIQACESEGLRDCKIISSTILSCTNGKSARTVHNINSPGREGKCVGEAVVRGN